MTNVCFMREYKALKIAIDEAPSIPPCQTSDPEVWFSDPITGSWDFRVAKKLCGECPVRQQCLEYALVANERHGIWGGMTLKERRAYASKRSGVRTPVGRPRKDTIS